MGKFDSIEELTKRFRVIDMLYKGSITEAQAAEELSLSVRQARRLLCGYEDTPEEERNIEVFRYKRVHPAANRTPQEIRKKVIEIYEENPSRSCQHITELLPGKLSDEEKEILGSVGKSNLSRWTVRNILSEAGIEIVGYQKSKPAVRFEMTSFGELVQIDTTSFPWEPVCRRVYLIMVIDDYSRMILAGRFFTSDSTYNNMLVLREVIEKYDKFCAAYSDNDSKFNYLRQKKTFRTCKGFFDYKTPPEGVITEIEMALLSLGIPFFHHYPGNAKAKGKIEALNKFIKRRFISEYRGNKIPLDDVNKDFFPWIEWYNTSWVNRDVGVAPCFRMKPTVFTPLSSETNLDDIFCLKEERKVGKDNSFSYKGAIFTIPKEHNLVAMKVSLSVHPDVKVRVLHKGNFICEFPYQNKKLKPIPSDTNIISGMKDLIRAVDAIPEKEDRTEPLPKITLSEAIDRIQSAALGEKLSVFLQYDTEIMNEVFRRLTVEDRPKLLSWIAKELNKESIF